MSDNYISNPRIIVVQKLYSHYFNQEEELDFPKHKFKKFIKDVVMGTIERKDVIISLIEKDLSDDINLDRSESLLKIIIMSAIYELLYRPETSKKIIINEYLNVSTLFLKDIQKNYINAILDKISKNIRNE
tara:strand:- start:129 stop:521 length:393 start_codon:yes stop_codon:yes gene_type:complete